MIRRGSRWSYMVRGEEVIVVLGESTPCGQVLADEPAHDCDCIHTNKAWDSTGFLVHASERCCHGLVILDNPPVLAMQNIESLLDEIVKKSPPKDPLVRLIWDLNNSYYQDRITNNVCEESDEK